MKQQGKGDGMNAIDDIKRFDEIRREYIAGDIAAIDAIERLQGLGLQPKRAEALVDGWDAYRKKPLVNGWDAYRGKP